MQPTAIQNLKEKTDVYETHLDVRRFEWDRGKVKRLYVLGDSVSFGKPSDSAQDANKVAGYYFKQGRTLSADALSIEFFNHELMDVNTELEQSIFEFVSKWGFPYSPVRQVNHKPPEFARAHYQACKKTEKLARTVEAARAAEGETPCNPPFAVATEYDDIVISLEEASITIAALQSSVRSIWHHFTDGGQLKMYWVNLGKLYPYEIWSGDYLQGEPPNEYGTFGGLTAAICNQIISAAMNDTPWRKCACEECPVVFQYKQSSALSPNADSHYCSKKCEERQKKRNQRSKKKANPAR